MPILILLLIAVLVAQIGFWDTFNAVLGALGVVILLVLVVGALLAALAYYAFHRVRRRF